MSEHETRQVVASPPEEQEQEPRLSRRTFLRVGGVGSAAAALAACQQAPAPPVAVSETSGASATNIPASATADASAAPPASAVPAATEASRAAAAGPLTSDLLPYPRLKIASLGDLASGAFSAAYPDDASPVQLIKLGTKTVGGVGPDGDIVAYSGLCTHMGCPLVYVAESKIFQCPCHYSHFDVEQDAMLINGPATQHLPRLTLEIDGEDIYAVGMQGLVYGRPHNLSLT